MSEIDRKPLANIPPFGLRMQPDLKARIEAAARANNRSINSEIVARLEADFAREDRMARAEFESQDFNYQPTLDELHKYISRLIDIINEKTLVPEERHSMNAEIVARIEESFAGLQSEGREAVLALLAALGKPEDKEAVSNARLLGARYVSGVSYENLGSLTGLRGALMAMDDEDPAAKLIQHTIDRYMEDTGNKLARIDFEALVRRLQASMENKYPGKAINEVIEEQEAEEKRLALDRDK